MRVHEDLFVAVGKHMHGGKLDHRALEERGFLFRGQPALPERPRELDKLANDFRRFFQLEKQAHMRDCLLP